MGARGGQAFWRIYFRLSLPGVAAAGLLVFITALGFFITPALLGGRRETMIAQLVNPFRTVQASTELRCAVDECGVRQRALAAELAALRVGVDTPPS